MSKSGAIGWAGIAAYVIAYDYWAIRTDNETLSGACWRSLSHPYGKWVTLTIVTGLVKHLVAPDLLPKVDPLYYVARRWHGEST
jgi:hypothetical protein